MTGADVGNILVIVAGLAICVVFVRRNLRLRTRLRDEGRRVPGAITVSLVAFVVAMVAGVLAIVFQLLGA